jgi:hypothetical protein
LKAEPEIRLVCRCLFERWPREHGLEKEEKPLEGYVIKVTVVGNGARFPRIFYELCPWQTGCKSILNMGWPCDLLWMARCGGTIHLFQV